MHRGSFVLFELKRFLESTWYEILRVDPEVTILISLSSKSALRILSEDDDALNPIFH